MNGWMDGWIIIIHLSIMNVYLSICVQFSCERVVVLLNFAGKTPDWFDPFGEWNR